MGKPERRVHDSVPGPSQATRDMLATLVGFDTTSSRSNLELIDYVYEYLSDLGLQPRLDFNSDRSKANLYALVGPNRCPGIALSGHTDVVPVAGQDWHRDPWQLSEQDGRYYGRGTTDMKGFIAVVLVAVPAMLDAALQRPVHLCLSYDEEVGCIGVRSLLAYLAGKKLKPAACIVGEPTGMQVINGHKGKLSYRCHVKGRACHSALAPQGVNAVEAAAEVVTFLGRLARRKAELGPFDESFDIPYSTVHTGVIRGGTTVNIVPEECRFDFEVRNLPSEDPESVIEEVRRYAHQQLEPKMHQRAPDTGFRWQQLARFPGLDTDPELEIVGLAQRLTGGGRTHKVAFGTEAGGFDGIGIPTVVCGPGHIQQAHTPDEFVETAQIADCERFVLRLIEHLSEE